MMGNHKLREEIFVCEKKLVKDWQIEQGIVIEEGKI